MLKGPSSRAGRSSGDVCSGRRRRSRLVGAAAAGASLAGASFTAGLALSACSEGATEGARVLVETRVETSEASSLVFENSFGYELRVEEAYLALKAIRYAEGAPATVGYRGEPRNPGLLPSHHAPGWSKTVGRWLGVSAAHAHPGHFEEGLVVAEATTSVVVDLLAGRSLGSAEGITGVARSATLTLDPTPEGPLAGELEGGVLRVVGTAASGEASVRFAGSVGASSFEGTDGAPEVRQIPVRDGVIEGSGRMTLRVDVAAWLDEVDFGELLGEGGSAAAAEGAVPIEPGSKAHRGLIRGVRKTLAYDIEFSSSGQLL